MIIFDQFWVFCCDKRMNLPKQNHFLNQTLPFFLSFPQKDPLTITTTPNKNPPQIPKSTSSNPLLPTFYQDQENVGKFVQDGLLGHLGPLGCKYLWQDYLCSHNCLGQPVPSSDGSHPWMPSLGAIRPTAQRPRSSFCLEAQVKTARALFAAVNKEHLDIACSASHLTASQAPCFRATPRSSVGLAQRGRRDPGRAGPMVTEVRRNFAIHCKKTDQSFSSVVKLEIKPPPLHYNSSATSFYLLLPSAGKNKIITVGKC